MLLFLLERKVVFVQGNDAGRASSTSSTGLAVYQPPTSRLHNEFFQKNSESQFSLETNGGPTKYLCDRCRQLPLKFKSCDILIIMSESVS